MMYSTGATLKGPLAHSSRSFMSLVVAILLMSAALRQANAQNGCNNIPTTTPTGSSGVFGGPGGVPAGTSFVAVFAYASASNTPSTITVTTSGGATFGTITWSCTQKITFQAFFYTTVVDNETFSISEIDAGGAGAGFSAAGAPLPKNLACSASAGAPIFLCGNPINPATGNKFQVETDYLSPPNTHLELRRYYNSAGINAIGLGALWRSSYDRSVYRGTGSKLAQVIRGDGRVDSFWLNNGVWAGDSDVTTTLSPVPLSGTQTAWQVVTEDDTIEIYNLAGQLILITSRGGLVTTLGYNSAGQLTAVTGPFSQTLTFSYNAAGQRTQVTDPEGGVYTYAYDSNNNLTSVTYPDSAVKRYVYENTSFPNALTGIIDENSKRFATWSYDSRGRAISSQHAGGAELTTVTYNNDGTSIVTNALGQQAKYTFSTLQNMRKLTEIDRLATSTTTAASEKFTYDSNGYLASATDWNGNITTRVNDTRGEPTTINEAVGTPQARTTTITYLATLHLPVSIVTPGLTTAFAYDANGNLLTKTLTDTTATIVPYSTNGSVRTWTYTYGANYLLASSKGPRTDVSELTSLSYDNAGVLTTITNALGQPTKVTQHTAGGLPLTLVDVNGVTSTFTYDARQRLLTRSLATTGGALVTTFNYDAVGNLLKTTLPDGSALTNGYDQAHRMTSVTDLFGQSASYTLDARGDRIQT